MGYNKENYAKIRQIYQDKSRLASEAAERRCAELYANHPELRKIDSALSETGVRILQESAKGREGLEERIAALRDNNMELQAARRAYLESVGYPADYTDVKYECDRCRDTGFDGVGMCDCMRRALVLAGYESSGIGKLIATQSFDSFNLDYYDGSAQERTAMGSVLDSCKKFANNFDGSGRSNMLFFGATGLGKTHLSTAVSKAVIDKGYDVVYDTAQNILSDFEYERFVRGYGDTSESKTKKYFECDLLIVDDLGTETANQFTAGCIYNLINTRINNSKSMVISTNLTSKDIRQNYNERIHSRLFGNFLPLHFVGKDIRMKKVMK